jgi:hypothetical protein
MAIRNSPQAVMNIPRGRPREVPGNGHRNSPGTATRTPRGRPRFWVWVNRREASPPCPRSHRPSARILLQ